MMSLNDLKNIFGILALLIFLLFSYVLVTYGQIFMPINTYISDKLMSAFSPILILITFGVFIWGVLSSYNHCEVVISEWLTTSAF